MMMSRVEDLLEKEAMVKSRILGILFCPKQICIQEDIYGQMATVLEEV